MTIPVPSPTNNGIPAGENENGKTITGTVIPLVFATIFILGRAYSRIVLIRCWGWDDTLIIVSWLGTILTQAAPWVQLGGQVTSHSANLLVFTVGLAYQCSISFTKLSILCSYLRIVPMGRYRTLTWASIGVVCVAFAILFTMYTISCNLNTGTFFFNNNHNCRPFLPTLYASSVTHCLLDAWLIVLIVPFIATFQIPFRQKLALCIILSLGVLVIIANFSRLIYITHAFNLFAFSVCSSIEQNVGLFCASAPANLPLLRKLAPSVMRKVMGANVYVQRGDGISTQLSRIRAGERAQNLEGGSLRSTNGTVELKSSTERSSGTASSTKPWGVGMSNERSDSQIHVLPQAPQKEGASRSSIVSIDEAISGSGSPQEAYFTERTGSRDLGVIVRAS